MEASCPATRCSTCSLVSFGFPYVVHHPALRKLVDFRRGLPDKTDGHDDLVQYDEGHQTLVLKAPRNDPAHAHARTRHCNLMFR